MSKNWKGLNSNIVSSKDNDTTRWISNDKPLPDSFIVKIKVKKCEQFKGNFIGFSDKEIDLTQNESKFLGREIGFFGFGFKGTAYVDGKYNEYDFDLKENIEISIAKHKKTILVFNETVPIGLFNLKADHKSSFICAQIQGETILEIISIEEKKLDGIEQLELM